MQGTIATPVGKEKSEQRSEWLSVKRKQERKQTSLKQKATIKNIDNQGKQNTGKPKKNRKS